MNIRTAKDAVRPLLRAVRHGPDRLLHPFRRRRLLARLRRAPTPGSALFICLGNINRSPFAAAAFEREMASKGCNTLRVRSAGFIGPGRPVSEAAQRLGAERGLDLTGHVSRLIDPAEVCETDLVVVMDVKQRRRVARETGRRKRDIVVLGDLDPAHIVRRVVQDPYGHPREVFERVFDRIDRCVDVLAGATCTEPGRSAAPDP